jgi:hypothetical protein
MIDEGAKHPIDLRLWRIVAFGVQCPFDHAQYPPPIIRRPSSPARPNAPAGCGAPLGSARQWIKEDERASLRRDADDVVIRFAGILEIAGAQS